MNMLDQDDPMDPVQTQSVYETCPIDMTKPPRLLHDETICQATNAEFIKAAKFSPDGNVVATASESNFLTFWNVAPSIISSHCYYPIYGSDLTGSSNAPAPLSLFSATSIGEAIHDYVWYPLMTQSNPSSNCVAVTSRDHPIQLWDCVTGELRCKYSGYNHMDELDSAQCLAFNLTGDKIYGGANRVIRIFDVANPGRQETTIPTCKSRSDKTGQKGIISTIAFCPDYSGFYAAGSFGQSLALYAENSNKRVAMLSKLNMGVTCTKWSPCGKYLWAGGRKNSDLVCLDIRMTKREVGRVTRLLNSNQRVTFDMDPWGRFIITGTQDGRVLVYDTLTFELLSCNEITPMSPFEEMAHDCVNAVSVHPFSSVFVTTTGQRHFSETYEDTDNNLDEGCLRATVTKAKEAVDGNTLVTSRDTASTKEDTPISTETRNPTNGVATNNSLSSSKSPLYSTGLQLWSMSLNSAKL